MIHRNCLCDFLGLKFIVHLPELLTVTKNNIHVLVKCLELADEGARVLELIIKNSTNIFAAPLKVQTYISLT